MEEKSNNGDNLKCIHHPPMTKWKYKMFMNIDHKHEHWTCSHSSFILIHFLFPSFFFHHADSNDERKRQTKIEVKHKLFSQLTQHETNIFPWCEKKPNYFISKTIWWMPFFCLSNKHTAYGFSVKECVEWEKHLFCSE